VKRLVEQDRVRPPRAHEQDVPVRGLDLGHVAAEVLGAQRVPDLLGDAAASIGEGVTKPPQLSQPKA
jgi:hypothetical protein